MTRRERTSARELKARLAADPGYQERLAEGTRRRRAASDETRRAVAPLYAALEAAGVDVATFGTPRFDERVARPLLLEWLPRIEHPGVRAVILRHLGSHEDTPDGE
jgi:hypothetical protein